MSSEIAQVSSGRPGPGRQNIGQQRCETTHCVRELLYLGLAGPNGRGVCVGEKLGVLVRKKTHKKQTDKIEMLKCLW